MPRQSTNPSTNLQNQSLPLLSYSFSKWARIIKLFLWDVKPLPVLTPSIFTAVVMQSQGVCLLDHKPTGTCCIHFLWCALMCLLNELLQPETHYSWAHVENLILTNQHMKEFYRGCYVMRPGSRTSTRTNTSMRFLSGTNDCFKAAACKKIRGDI